jgi:hypothetical protein
VSPEPAPDARPRRDTLHGVEVCVSPWMVGAKTAVRFGTGPVFVSAAMFELLTKEADPAAFRRLLESLKVLRLPAMPTAFGPVPPPGV